MSAAIRERIDCEQRCEVPAGYALGDVPRPRHNWPDVVHCPNDGCGRSFLIVAVPDPTPMEPCEVCQEPTETPPICARCDIKQKEETWSTPVPASTGRGSTESTSPIPAGPTASQRTRDEPTSTFPTRAGDGTQQPSTDGGSHGA